MVVLPPSMIPHLKYLQLQSPEICSISCGDIRYCAGPESLAFRIAASSGSTRPVIRKTTDNLRPTSSRVLLGGGVCGGGRGTEAIAGRGDLQFGQSELLNATSSPQDVQRSSFMRLSR